jgi:DNA-binding winged helix-turn-helix (wHTH) protein
MAPGRFRFEGFLLDPHDRQLRRHDESVELNARYLDALALLVREHGRLVSKDRFLEEVWRGVPVTDEALTQCIRTLRRQLGDDAGRPRFIETVPKHGYRFIAAVERVDEAPAPVPSTTASPPVGPPAAERIAPAPLIALLAAAGMAGGGGAGVLGGLFYGFIGASQPLQAGMGAVSILLVLTCLTVFVGLIGGLGVGLGIAWSGFAAGRPGPWSILGGALGGLVVGAAVKLVAGDAFSLLFGQTPGNITGAPEGALLGAAVGVGAWLANRGPDALRLRRSVTAAALAGGAAGAVIPLTGGALMGGSLAQLAGRFPGSRLRLDQIGALVGETGYGPVSQSLTGALEGALFSACLVAAMILARRALHGDGWRALLRPTPVD